MDILLRGGVHLLEQTALDILSRLLPFRRGRAACLLPVCCACPDPSVFKDEVLFFDQGLAGSRRKDLFRPGFPARVRRGSRDAACFRSACGVRIRLTLLPGNVSAGRGRGNRGMVDGGLFPQGLAGHPVRFRAPVPVDPVQAPGFEGFRMERCLLLFPLFLLQAFLLRPLLRGRHDSGLRHKLHLMQAAVDRFIDKIKDPLAVGKVDLHFARVHIDIDLLGRQFQMQDGKWKAVLHQVGPVALLQGPGQEVGPQHPAVDKAYLKIAAGPADLRPAQEAFQVVFLQIRADGDQAGGNLPAVDAVDQFLQLPVAGGMQLFLAADLVMEGNTGMGQGLVLDQVRDIARLRLGLAQELPADRYVIKEIADDHGRAVRGADLLQFQRDPVLPAGLCARQAGGPDPRQAVPGLGDHLHLGDSRDRGQSLAPEAQCRQAVQVAFRPDLAGGVAGKGRRDLLRRDARPVVGDPDQGDAPVPDFDTDGRGARVYGVLDQFLGHVEGPFHDLARRDPVDGLFT